MVTHYVLWYRLNGVDAYLLWYDGGEDRDGVVFSVAGVLLKFSTPEQVSERATELGLVFKNEEAILHNLDVIQDWLKQPDPLKIICNDFNSAWNLFTDVAYSAFSDDFIENTADIDRIYDKLFWGCNLPVFTPEGKSYHPTWTTDEVELIHQILQKGLALLVSKLPK